MEDDDWGMGTEDTSAAKQEEKVEKQEEKQKQEEQNKDQDESSWIIEKPKEELPTKEPRGRNTGRTELKQAIV